jgi:hypothetical protein
MSSVATPRPWLARHWQKLVALLFWAGLLGGYAWYAWSRSLSPLEVAERLQAYQA